VNLIEWPTLGVIIGSSIFVEIAARSGIFTWSAIRLLKASRGDPWKLLLLLGILTLVFSAFLNNVTAMIIVGSLTVVACKRLDMEARPFLLAEAFLTNVGGLLTLISSLPNIILGHPDVGVLAVMGDGIQWLIDATGAGAAAILVWVTGILSGLTDNVPSENPPQADFRQGGGVDVS